MNTRRSLALLLCCATLGSCAQPPAPAPEPESARLAQELRVLIGPAACASDAQCRTVAVGTKACGGPAGYRAWSTQDAKAEAITALAARQAAAERRELEASGLQSNCAVVVDPGASCVAGRCQLVTAVGAR